MALVGGPKILNARQRSRSAAFCGFNVRIEWCVQINPRRSKVCALMRRKRCPSVIVQLHGFG